MPPVLCNIGGLGEFGVIRHSPMYCSAYSYDKLNGTLVYSQTVEVDSAKVDNPLAWSCLDTM